MDFQLELIKWLDSEAVMGWAPRRTAEKINEILSVGWVVAETEDYIILSAHRDDMNENDHSPMQIPKVAITKRKKVKVNGK